MGLLERPPITEQAKQMLWAWLDRTFPDHRAEMLHTVDNGDLEVYFGGKSPAFFTRKELAEWGADAGGDNYQVERIRERVLEQANREREE